MNGECGRVSVPGCSSRYRWGTGPCRIGAWQRGGTVSDRQADVFAGGRGWRACLSRATRFRWRIGIEIACMETMKEILERAAASPAGKELAAAAASGEVAVLKGVSGSAYALYAAAVVERRGGVHIFVCGDRDAAAYLMNDFYSLLGEEGVMFFPTGYKRSVQFGQEDASGVVQRTAALNALRGFEGKRHLVVCTYPEALAEKVADAGELGRRTVTVGCGERMEMSFLADVLEEYGFTKVDFVYEPGQYSLRGGFDIASQLSTEKLEQVEIVPDMKGSVSAGHSVSLPEFAGEAVWWADDLSHTLRRVDDIRKKMLAEADAPERVDARVRTGRCCCGGTARRSCPPPVRSFSIPCRSPLSINVMSCLPKIYMTEAKRVTKSASFPITRRR